MMPVYFSALKPYWSQRKSLIFHYEQSCSCYLLTYNEHEGNICGLVLDSNLTVKDTISNIGDDHWLSATDDGYLYLGQAIKNRYYAQTIMRLDTGKRVAFHWSPFDESSKINIEQSYWNQCYDYTNKYDFQHANSLATIQTPLGRFTGISSRNLNEITIIKEENGSMTRIRPLRAIFFKQFLGHSDLRETHDKWANATWMNDSVGFTGPHDLRFVYYDNSDSSIYFSLWNNASCSERLSRFMLIKLLVNKKEVFVERSFTINRFGDGKGSGQLLLDHSTAKNRDELFSANLAFNHGGFDLPSGFTPSEPQFGVADSGGRILFGAHYDDKYRISLYQFQEVKKLPVHQPEIQCQQNVPGEFSLTVTAKEFNDIQWINGSSGQTITVTQPADYIAWMKNDAMLGYLCSRPISVNDKSCPLKSSH
jgi:hypothetical protein